MNKKHKFGVIIGRFQPFHNAHLELVRFALSQVENLIIVLGSANQARTVKNPWTTEERINMIKAGMEDLYDPSENRVEFVAAKDYLYNDNMWLIAVQENISVLTDDSDDVVLVGHKKDRSSFYLNLFPQWEYIEAGTFEEGIDATRVRDMYFRCDIIGIKAHCPEPVTEILRQSMLKTTYTCEPDFLRLKEEYDHVQEYKALWNVAPYPPTFVTTDSVVIKSGHVLVVRRKSHPGRGLIALPGGFLNQHEKIQDGAIRELKEETRIGVSKEDLKSSIMMDRVFDHPDRSLRGRTITHAFLINLGHGKLPKVAGSDDADKAWWMPLRDAVASEELFFEDHFHILNFFVNKF